MSIIHMTLKVILTFSHGANISGSPIVIGRMPIFSQPLYFPLFQWHLSIAMPIKKSVTVSQDLAMSMMFPARPSARPHTSVK